MRIVERYVGFGDKASGGPGDIACGAWVEQELAAAGYSCRRQGYEMPAYEGEATLTAGSAVAALIPQAIVVPTQAGGLAGPLYVAGSGKGGPGIALLVLPHGRWCRGLHSPSCNGVDAPRGDTAVPSLA